MKDGQKTTYPDCPVVIRTIEVGGDSKEQLLQRLQQKEILINPFGEQLLADEKFTVSTQPYSVTTVELKVSDLGFPEGATIPVVYSKAEQLGLKLCLPELGPYLRMQYLDQPEGSIGKPVRKNRSPYGAITIASKKLSEDADFPRGFYLRKIEGKLWLRAYIADDLHVLDPEDHLIFCQNETLSETY